MTASDHLREAVEQELRREVDERRFEPGLTVTEFVLVAAAQGWDADGEPVTQILTVPSDAPHHRALGLLRHAQIRFEAEIAADYEPPDDDL